MRDMSSHIVARTADNMGGPFRGNSEWMCPKFLKFKIHYWGQHILLNNDTNIDISTLQCDFGFCPEIISHQSRNFLFSQKLMILPLISVACLFIQ